jgi:hypothetical protein
MTSYAGVPCTHEQIRGTLTLLRWYRAFINGDYEKARIPGEWGMYMNREEAKRRLMYMLEVAINRRGRLPEKRGCKDDYDYQIRLRRDQDRLRQIHHRVIVRQFETAEVRSRFAHLLSE